MRVWIDNSEVEQITHQTRLRSQEEAIIYPFQRDFDGGAQRYGSSSTRENEEAGGKGKKKNRKRVRRFFFFQAPLETRDTWSFTVIGFCRLPSVHEKSSLSVFHPSLISITYIRRPKPLLEIV